MKTQTSDSAQKGPGTGAVTKPGSVQTVKVPGVSGASMPQPPKTKG